MGRPDGAEIGHRCHGALVRSLAADLSGRQDAALSVVDEGD
jgi:hypothetical protein